MQKLRHGDTFLIEITEVNCEETDLEVTLSTNKIIKYLVFPVIKQN